MEALRLTAVQTTLTLIFGFASLLCTTALVPLVWLLPLVALVVIYNTFVYLGEFTITITKWGVHKTASLTHWLLLPFKRVTPFIFRGISVSMEKLNRVRHHFILCCQLVIILLCNLHRPRVVFMGMKRVIRGDPKIWYLDSCSNIHVIGEQHKDSLYKITRSLCTMAGGVKASCQGSCTLHFGTSDGGTAEVKVEEVQVMGQDRNILSEGLLQRIYTL